MAAFEVISIITTSSIWGCVSFKRTHLIERMGLLTLIILGEGIIVMLKAINTIVKGFGWTWTTLGVVSSSIALIVCFHFPAIIFFCRFTLALMPSLPPPSPFHHMAITPVYVTSRDHYNIPPLIILHDTVSILDVLLRFQSNENLLREVQTTALDPSPLSIPSSHRTLC